MVSNISPKVTFTIFPWILFTVNRSKGETTPVLHVIGFMKNRGTIGIASFEVTILNSNVDTANVYISTRDGPTRNFTLQSKRVHTESFSADVEVIEHALSRKGIKITSDKHLLVYGSSRILNGLGGFLSVPIEYQGYLYHVVTGGLTGQILVAGVYPNTCVKVTLRLTDNELIYDDTMYVNGSTITEILGEYDTMQIFSTGDLTGTEIRSSEAVTVFGGCRTDGEWPKKDHYLEQLPPLKHWGKRHVTVPPYGYQYHCKVLSGFSNTVVNYTCSMNTEKSLVLHDVGYYQTLNFNNWACLLISNQPILVTMMVSIDNEMPAMITIPPMKEVTEELMVFVSGMITSAQLVLITETNIIIDPAVSPSRTYFECPEHLNSCITYITDLVANQILTIRSTKQPFTISGFVFGVIRTKTSMGYPIIHHTSQEMNKASQFVNVTCEISTSSSTTLPDTFEGSYSTKDPYQTTNPDKACLCCNSKNYSLEEIEVMIQELRDKLLIKYSTTNIYLRSLTSAPDDRISSKAIGYTTGIILGTLATCMVITDLVNIMQMFNRIRGNVCSLLL